MNEYTFNMEKYHRGLWMSNEFTSKTVHNLARRRSKGRKVDCFTKE
jgi:hypothetical protein